MMIMALLLNTCNNICCILDVDMRDGGVFYSICCICHNTYTTPTIVVMNENKICQLLHLKKGSHKIENTNKII